MSKAISISIVAFSQGACIGQLLAPTYNYRRPPCTNLKSIMQAAVDDGLEGDELLAVRAGVENVHVCFDGCKIPGVRIRALLQSVLADQVPKVPVLSYCRRSHHGKELCMPPISSPTPPIHLSQHEKHVM